MPPDSERSEALEKVPSDSLTETEQAKIAEKDSQAVIQATPVMIPPAPPPGVQLAVGMQLFQQSAGAFHQLDKEVQLRMLELADKFDNNAFENAQESLKLNHEHRQARLGKISHALVVMAVLAALGLGAATVITVMLIKASKPELAKDLIVIGLTAVTSLLGGAGVVQLVKGLSGPNTKD